MSPPAPYRPIDSAVLTEADRCALIDLAAGRTIDSSAMAARLGGWQVARSFSFPTGEAPGRATQHDAATLVWTEVAVAECDRMHRLLATVQQEAGRRFAAAIVAAMVRAIVDGGDWPEGVGDMPLLATLTLRIKVSEDRLAVLGLHHSEVVR